MPLPPAEAEFQESQEKDQKFLYAHYVLLWAAGYCCCGKIPEFLHCLVCQWGLWSPIQGCPYHPTTHRRCILTALSGPSSYLLQNVLPCCPPGNGEHSPPARLPRSWSLITTSRSATSQKRHGLRVTPTVALYSSSVTVSLNQPHTLGIL